MKLLSLLFLFLVVACDHSRSPNQAVSVRLSTLKISSLLIDSIIFRKKNIADRFDFPVGKPNAKAYYNAQKFQVNNHLGDDWNGVGGGNTDLGDPIYAIANGYVSMAENIGGGWGNIVRIIHQMPDGQQVESLYAHSDSIFAQANHWVKRGDKIATIGDANGAYLAHLHFEIRDSVGMDIGGGYGAETAGYLDPTRFIKTHRRIAK